MQAALVASGRYIFRDEVDPDKQDDEPDWEPQEPAAQPAAPAARPRPSAVPEARSEAHSDTPVDDSDVLLDYSQVVWQGPDEGDYEATLAALLGDRSASVTLGEDEPLAPDFVSNGADREWV